MILIRTYSKLMLIRNYSKYLIVILSIIVTYILIAITMVYMDNVLVLSSETMYSNLHYIFISIRTLFLIAGITYIISQYYNIMKSSIRDFCILRGLGATRYTIRLLIFLQIIILIIISIPIGLYGGFMLTGTIVSLLGSFSLNKETLEEFASSTTFYIAAGAACSLIILVGLYLERCIRKMPLSDILSETPIICKEGLNYGDL